MRRRPAAQLIVLDPADRVLLFRFAFERGALAGQNYWAAPGGGVDPGETFEEAARRELSEETGIETNDVRPPIANREFVLQMYDGEQVISEERYFLVRAEGDAISREGWTELEREVMTEHRWWSLEELSSSRETIYPEGLIGILFAIGVGPEQKDRS